MKALILAAGLGTRLRPLTEKTPKPLLPIQGQPLLTYHFDSLRKVGIYDILINSHHLADQIEEFVNTYTTEYPEMNIVIKFEKILLGSAGTLKQNSHFFAEEDNFLVIYGDNLTDISYSSFLREHQRNDGVVTMACYEEEHPESKGIIETDAEGRILKFLEKPEPGKTVSKLANAGIYALSHDIFSYLHDFDKIPLDFGYDIFPFLLSKNETMFVYRMTESLLDIGTLESYTKAQRLAL